MPNKRKLKPATIEQTVKAYDSESFALAVDTLKKPAISPDKLRAIIGGAAFGVSFAAQSLANRDSDGDGIDDYFARKLQELALDMQAYAFTGKLPNGFTQ